MPRTWIAILLLCLTVWPVNARVPSRTIQGRVYFTNNIPDDRSTLPIELLSADGKRVLQSTTQGDGGFQFKGIKPGRYRIRFKGPRNCSLTYNVDLRKGSRRAVSILMDVECAHDDGTVMELPRR
jgi:hypothetical protein